MNKKPTEERSFFRVGELTCRMANGHINLCYSDLFQEDLGQGQLLFGAVPEFAFIQRETDAWNVRNLLENFWEVVDPTVETDQPRRHEQVDGGTIISIIIFDLLGKVGAMKSI